jgi:SAM-dependent methyltransferase
VDQFDATHPMPFDDNSFDAVTTLDVIEHNQDDLAILADSFRVLKPGGHMIITVPALMWLWSHNDDINAIRRYPAKTKQKLAQTSFVVRRVTYNAFIFPWQLPSFCCAMPKLPQLASRHFREEYQGNGTGFTAGQRRLPDRQNRGIIVELPCLLIAIGQKPGRTPGCSAVKFLSCLPPG